MRKQKTPEQLQKYKEHMLDLIMGSLIALCFLIVPIFPSLDMRDFSARFAILAFSVAIPSLIFSLLITNIYRLSKNKKPPLFRYVFMGTVGIIFSVVGLTSILWYFLPAAAFVFFVVGSLCFITYYNYENAVTSEMQEKKSPSNYQGRIASNLKK